MEQSRCGVRTATKPKKYPEQDPRFMFSVVGSVNPTIIQLSFNAITVAMISQEEIAG